MTEVVAGRLIIEWPKDIAPAAQRIILRDADADGTPMIAVTKIVLTADVNTDGGYMYADLTMLSDATGVPIDQDGRDGCRSRGMPVRDGATGSLWTVTQRWLVVEHA